MIQLCQQAPLIHRAPCLRAILDDRLLDHLHRVHLLGLLAPHQHHLAADRSLADQLELLEILLLGFFSVSGSRSSARGGSGRGSGGGWGGGGTA
jgi:hypothetical protein